MTQQQQQQQQQPVEAQSNMSTLDENSKSKRRRQVKATTAVSKTTKCTTKSWNTRHMILMFQVLVSFSFVLQVAQGWSIQVPSLSFSSVLSCSPRSISLLSMTIRPDDTDAAAAAAAEGGGVAGVGAGAGMHNCMLVPYAERALQSPRMAKHIRSLRTTRGRRVIGFEENENDHDESSFMSKPRSTKLLPQGRSSSLVTLTSSSPSSSSSLVAVSKTSSCTTSCTSRASATSTTARNHRHRSSNPRTLQSRQQAKKSSFSYASTLKALKAYHHLHHDLVLPRRFIVPDDSYETTTNNNNNDPSRYHYYPKEWHGVDLAQTVYRMSWWKTHIRQYPSRVTELNQLGFVWERLQPEWNLILEALITFKSIHGHLLVPISFKVPYGNQKTNYKKDMNKNKVHEKKNHVMNHHHHDDDDTSTTATTTTATQSSSSSSLWPRATWGIPLGQCVFRMRVRNDFLKGDAKGATRRAQLDGLGFIWDVNEYMFAKFCAALIHYPKVKGVEVLQQQQQQSASLFQLTIPTTFVVPSDSTWPRGLWKYPLGAKCVAVRQKGLYIRHHPEREATLKALLGLSWNHGATYRKWNQLIHAATIYAQLQNNHENHHENNEEHEAPQQQYPNYTLDVPVSFVVPAPPVMDATESCCLYVSDDCQDWPWPEYLWGYPLGLRLKDVRLKHAFLKHKVDGPQRRAQLNALGFVWTPKRGRRKQQQQSQTQTQKRKYTNKQ